MIRPSRYIPATVVDFGELVDISFGAEVLGELAGPRRKLTRRQKQIRRLLRKARALKKRIAHLRIRQPLGWKGAVRHAKTNLRVVMSDLKMAGWKPKKPRRQRKPGEDEMDAALDDIPETEPGESDDDPELDEPDEPDAAEGEGNWLDRHVGVEPATPKAKKPGFFVKAGKLLVPAWGPHKPLGDGARIQAKSGQSAMVATVSPGLFIVQIVSDAAAKRVAGDNVGILPLLLFPAVKDRVQKALAPKPAAPKPAAQPAPAQPAAAGLGCDDCRGR